MSEEKRNDELSTWFSTYGIITAERLLETYHIRLPHTDLMLALKNPDTMFYHMLKVPVRNVLNGIILSQANEYQVYAQKLFIDYLLSGESGKESSSPGESTREGIEAKRVAFISLGKSFHESEREHQLLIAESQASLIAFTKKWSSGLDSALKSNKTILEKNGIKQTLVNLKKASYYALSRSDYKTLGQLNAESDFIKHYSHFLELNPHAPFITDLIHAFTQFFKGFQDLDEQLQEYIVKTQEMTEGLRSFRTQFYETILDVTEQLNHLPDYSMDLNQIKVNKEALNFDKDSI